MSPRCSKCNAKLAESLDGVAVIKCSRCKTINLLKGEVRVESVVVTP